MGEKNLTFISRRFRNRCGTLWRRRRWWWRTLLNSTVQDSYTSLTKRYMSSSNRRDVCLNPETRYVHVHSHLPRPTQRRYRFSESLIVSGSRSVSTFLQFHTIHFLLAIGIGLGLGHCKHTITPEARRVYHNERTCSHLAQRVFHHHHY